LKTKFRSWRNIRDKAIDEGKIALYCTKCGRIFFFPSDKKLLYFLHQKIDCCENGAILFLIPKEEERAEWVPIDKNPNKVKIVRNLGDFIDEKTKWKIIIE